MRRWTRRYTADPTEGIRPLSDHFRFAVHPEYGFVAAPTATVTPHLAEWFLTREQFEPIPDLPGVYRITQPEQDGQRRTRQAVQDLRRHGFSVQADYSLDPALTPEPARPYVRNGLLERRQRIAQSAASASPQRAPALSTAPARPSAQPAAVPIAGRAPGVGPGRGR
ncbi:hypothetical protein RB200_23220 [Streptomyces sp. PmtG]